MHEGVRLIDANALIRKIGKIREMASAARGGLIRGNLNRLILKAVTESPTIEAVPVVRCLKCKYARELTYVEGIRFTSDCVVCMHPYGAGVSYPEYDMNDRIVWKSDYCSYGDPKPDGGANDGDQADPV